MATLFLPNVTCVWLSQKVKESILIYVVFFTVFFTICTIFPIFLLILTTNDLFIN